MLFELAGVIIEGNLIKLVQMFQRLRDNTMDPRLLKLCAVKIMQHPKCDDQKRKSFYDAIAHIPQFQNKRIALKLLKSYVNCSTSIPQLLAQEAEIMGKPQYENSINQINSTEDLAMLLQINNRILENDNCRFSFLVNVEQQKNPKLVDG